MNQIEQWEMTALSMLSQAPTHPKLRRKVRCVRGRMTPTARDITNAMMLKPVELKKLKTQIGAIAREFLDRGSATNKKNFKC
jgi:hypothetical protein